VQTRKKPITIMLSLLATLTLLFGGWFLYTKMEVEEPLRHFIGQMKSAELADLQVEKEQLVIQLDVTKPELFPEEYRALVKTVQELAPGKQVDIRIADRDQVLQEIWANGVFLFTEAVDLHQYSKIPTLLGEWKNTYQLDDASAQMDEANIYVYLKRDQAEFFTIIPRTSARQEVTAHG
jgi:hypothetical protein